MEQTLKNLVGIYKNYEVWFIGHSLGGAKAEMSVLSMLFKHLVSQKKVKLLTFGSTRVGDMSFVNLIETLVWYPNGMRPGAKYFVCLGAEDPQCSTRLSPWEIRAADNDVYFERSMQHWFVMVSEVIFRSCNSLSRTPNTVAGSKVALMK
ncbi:unnamed protein product [Strongylus vulgaris]|uniref:Fungal lipase-type domain-containing protein n=1 Tax=Strongylus vulgaris TaxID=40348 RepID=A0A3P7JIL3_STRVU|nr:unnamed protein product [Strongylus vulgaris]